MTGAVWLIGVGTMAVLGGIVILTAMLLGIRLGSEQGSCTRRKRSRYEFQPIHAVAVIAGLVALLLTRWVAIGVGVAGAVVLVPSLLAKSDAQQQITRLEALGSWTRRLGDLLASGAASSLDSALVKSVAVAPAVITSEVGALAVRIGLQGF